MNLQFPWCNSTVWDTSTHSVILSHSLSFKHVAPCLWCRFSVKYLKSQAERSLQTGKSATAARIYGMIVWICAALCLCCFWWFSLFSLVLSLMLTQNPKYRQCEMSPVTSSKVNRKSTLDVRHYSAVLTGCKVKWTSCVKFSECL